MAFKVQVGPPQIAIHQGQTVLVSEPDGHVNWPSEKGLYFLDTRIISNWTIYANGEPWELLNGGPINYHAARIFLTNKSILTEDGPIPPRTIGLTISRSIIGGMHEDLDVTNNSMSPVRFQLEIALRCDFADIFEVKSTRIVRRGRILTQRSEAHQHLRTTYRNGDFSRAVTGTLFFVPSATFLDALGQEGPAPAPKSMAEPSPSKGPASDGSLGIGSLKGEKGQ